MLNHKKKILKDLDKKQFYGDYDCPLNGKNIHCKLPGHEDKTPSLSIDSETGLFNCFGCGRSGNMIDWYMHMHNVSFVEASKQIAKKYNISLEKKDKSFKVQLLKLIEFDLENEEIKNWFKRKNITKPALIKEKYKLLWCENNNVIAMPVGKRYKLIPIDSREHRWDIDSNEPIEKKYLEIYPHKNQKSLLLIEGPSNLWSLECLADDNFNERFYTITSLHGVTSTHKLNEVVNFSSFSAIYTCLDGDQPGQNEAKKIKRKFSNVINIVLPQEDLRDYLKENDLETFQSLLITTQASNDEVEESNDDAEENTALRKSQTDRLLEMVEQKVNEGEIIFFVNDLKESYTRVTIKEHQEIWSCKSKQFKYYLRGLFWKEFNSSINNDSLSNAIGNIECRAFYDGSEFKLYNRVAKLADGSVWYDLCDGKWRAVKITRAGWEIINPPVLFKRYSHQLPQMEPVTNGDVKGILKFVNIKDKKYEILFLVDLVSSFIEGFPHAILIVSGTQGSAKSTLLRLKRKLVDPSSIETSSLGGDSNYRELVQFLHHHWCPIFDNVSNISNALSDALCRAVTGDGFSKRELFTDDDDIIYNFRRCIGLNGIHLVVTKPDLLERSILLELERISDSERKLEEELFEEFERERPNILGGIFNAISKALQIKPSIKLTALPRMADFTVWGCAIAEALGYSQDDFLNAYYSNIKNQNEEVLSSSPVAQVTISLMEKRSELIGTASELLKEFNEEAEKLKINIRERGWPKAANAFSRELNKLKNNMISCGIKIWSTKSKTKIIHIQKDSGSIDETDNTVETVKQLKINENKSDDVRGDIENGSTVQKAQYSKELDEKYDVGDKADINPSYKKWQEDKHTEEKILISDESEEIELIDELKERVEELDALNQDKN